MVEFFISAVRMLLLDDQCFPNIYIIPASKNRSLGLILYVRKMSNMVVLIR